MKLSEIAKKIDIEFAGEDREISGINTLVDAKADELSFIHRSKYSQDLDNTRAAAVLLQEKLKSRLPAGVAALVTDEPYLKLAQASKLFAKPLMQQKGKEAVMGSDCTIASGVFIGKDAVIGNNVTLMSGVSVGDNTCIGDDVVLYPNVVVYRDCIIGDRSIIHAGTVIGSDGYGFADTHDGRHIKIYQNGNVIIGNDVEIGANCTIDRAVFGSTVIKDGSKLDNLIQVGHNSVIGEHCLIVSQAGISGSATLGRNVVLAGQSGVAGHLSVGDFAVVHARGVVSKSIEGHKQYAGFPLREHRTWLKLQGKISSLLKKKP